MKGRETQNQDAEQKNSQTLILPGIEPGTLSVLDSRDNHYTTESTDNQWEVNCMHNAMFPNTKSTITYDYLCLL